MSKQAPSVQDRNAIYRRQICQLLSSVPKEDAILKQMEACLGRHALEKDAASVNHQSEELDMRVPPSLVHCHGCGVCLQGPVRIQSVARGRTRRRRAARRMAALKRAQNRESKSQQQQKQRQQQPQTFVDETELKRLYQVTDGTSKNIVVQTCDHCDGKQKMKAMDARKVSAARKRKIEPAKKEVVDEYISLPASKKPEQPRQRSQQTLQSPLLLAGGKKKKRKKSKANESGLMNFLSSLNN